MKWPSLWVDGLSLAKWITEGTHWVVMRDIRVRQLSNEQFVWIQTF